MSFGENIGTNLALIITETGLLQQGRMGRQRKLHWKTEWLVYNLYVQCNTNMKCISALFGISVTLIHTIVYTWANALCVILANFFPVPTRSQMLRVYPKSVIKK